VTSVKLCGCAYGQTCQIHIGISSGPPGVSFRHRHLGEKPVMRLFQPRARGRYLLQLPGVFGTKSQPSLLFFTGHCNLCERKRHPSQSQAPSMHMRVSGSNRQPQGDFPFHPPLRPCTFHDHPFGSCRNCRNSFEPGGCSPLSRPPWITPFRSSFSLGSGLIPSQEVLRWTPLRYSHVPRWISWYAGIRQDYSTTRHRDDARLWRKI